MTYFVYGKLWFDKINGNTYCNAKIMDENGDTIHYTGYKYGYGSYYLQAAKEYIFKVLKDKNAKIIDLGSSYDLQKVLKNNLF